MDMISVYESFQNSQMGYVLTCHNLRMHFCLFSLLLKENFQNHRLIFRKCKFSNFFKISKFPKIQNVLLLFCYCHDTDHMYNENSLKFLIDNQFSQKNAILHFLPQKFCIINHIIEVAAKSKF